MARIGHRNEVQSADEMGDGDTSCRLFGSDRTAADRVIVFNMCNTPPAGGQKAAEELVTVAEATTEAQILLCQLDLFDVGGISFTPQIACKMR